MKKHGRMVELSTIQMHVSLERLGKVAPINYVWWLANWFLVGNNWYENGDPRPLYSVSRANWYSSRNWVRYTLCMIGFLVSLNYQESSS